MHGVIFLFKYPTGGDQNKSSSHGRPESGTYDYDAAQTLFFARQTIQNACGTQALLSVLLNRDGRQVDVGAALTEFKTFAEGLPSDIRGEALSNSELIRDVHNSFARSSPFIDETQRTATEDDDVYHFIAYTPINGQLYELDGLQPAPITHGPCSMDEFPDKVIPVLRERIERYPAEEIRFNLMAVVGDLRIKAREIGDQQWLEKEEQKRLVWRRENALRRHNFVGLVGEVLKCVVRTKLQEGEGAYEHWIRDATTKRTARMEDRAKRSSGGTKA